MPFQELFYAFFGGLVPAALWLWFWLQEDSANPEPRGLVVVTFIAGIVAVLFVLPLQQIVYHYFYNYFRESTVLLFFLLALVEEFMKFFVAYVVAFRSKAFDEPIDAVIYMVTAALGFTALENALFLFDPLSNGSIVESIVTGNMRFIGASILHVMSSAIVGLSLALCFYKDRKVRRHMIFFGIIAATVLHTAFNLSIISDSGSNLFVTFLILWFSVIGLLLFFEKIKRLNPIKII